MLNHFAGFSCDLYLLNNSLPTNKPPAQKHTSIAIKLAEDQNNFCLVGSSRKGVSSIKPKNRPLKIIRKMPALICLFFLFISLNVLNEFIPISVSSSIFNKCLHRCIFCSHCSKNLVFCYRC